MSFKKSTSFLLLGVCSLYVQASTEIDLPTRNNTEKREVSDSLSTHVNYSYSDITNKPTSLPKLAENDTADENTSFLNTYQDDITSVASDLSNLDDDQSTSDYLKQRVNDVAIENVSGSINSEVNNWLNRNGRGNFNINLDEEWGLDTLDLDYLLPIYGTEYNQFFSQLGVHTWQERNLADIGIGYRQIVSDYLFGINAFFDQDMTYKHQRGSLGVEAGAQYFDFRSNYYMPLSAWKTQTVGDTEMQARAAKGVDAKITGYLPLNPQFSGSVEYFSWDGLVDMSNQPTDDTTLSAVNRMGLNPKGTNLSLAWRPIPLISAEFTKTLSNDIEDNDKTFGVTLRYNFDQTLDEQLMAKNVASERMLSNMKTALVDRNNKMYLAYKKIDPTIDTSVTIDLNIESGEILAAGQSILLTPSISAPTGVAFVAYHWQGTATPYLSDPDIENPTLTLPKDQEGQTLSLRLTIEEENGAIIRSDEKTLKLVSSIYEVHFFKDAQYTQPANINQGGFYETQSTGNTLPSESSKIFWKVNVRSYGRNIEKITCTPNSLNNSKNASQNDSCTYSWYDPKNILINKRELEPYIKGDLANANYFVKLKVTPKDKTPLTFNIPVHGVTANQSDIHWEVGGIENNVLKDVYSPSATDNTLKRFAKARASQYNEGNITYKMGKIPKTIIPIDSIDEKTGAYIIKREGEVMIYATHTPGPRHTFEPTAIKYILKVKGSDNDIYWSDPNANNGKKVIRNYSTSQIKNITAEYNGNASSLSYSIDKETIATINQNTGIITAKAIGEAVITATTNEKFPKTSNYTLEIVTGEINVKWKNSPNGILTIHKADRAVNLDVDINESTSENSLSSKYFDVIYALSDPDNGIVDLNENYVIPKNIGTTTINVKVKSKDGLYEEKTQPLTIIVTD